MKLTIFIIAVVGLLGPMWTADARPSKVLELLARERNRRDTDCETLARSAGEALEFYMRNSYISFTMRDIIENFLGIDPVNPDEMLRAMCRLSEAHSLRDLKEAFDDLDITPHLITGAYNMGVAGLPGVQRYLQYARQNGLIPPGERAMFDAVENAVNTLNGSHLIGFDPEGTQWTIEYMYRPPVPVNDWPPHNTAQHVDTAALCDDLMEAINIMLDNLEFDPSNNDELMASEIYAMTGFGISDREIIRDIVCRITETTNIQDLGNELENAGIVNNAFVNLYSHSVSFLLREKRRYEYERDESNPYHQEWLAYITPRKAAYLPFLNAMAEKGLLSLENDLTD